MKIVNKTKFIKAITVIAIIVGAIIMFSTKTYSKNDIKYREDYIYAGDTVWSIAKYESENNKYFKNKDIREVVYEIEKVNNFSNSNLYIGQKIKIPEYK